MRKSLENRRIFLAEIEHVLSSMILLADFLYIRQQILFMFPRELLATENKYLFQSSIEFVIYFCSLDAKKVMQVLFCDLHSAVVLADNV